MVRDTKSLKEKCAMFVFTNPQKATKSIGSKWGVNRCNAEKLA